MYLRYQTLQIPVVRPDTKPLSIAISGPYRSKPCAGYVLLGVSVNTLLCGLCKPLYGAVLSIRLLLPNYYYTALAAPYSVG